MRPRELPNSALKQTAPLALLVGVYTSSRRLSGRLAQCQSALQLRASVGPLLGGW